MGGFGILQQLTFVKIEPSTRKFRTIKLTVRAFRKPVSLPPLDLRGSFFPTA